MHPRPFPALLTLAGAALVTFAASPSLAQENTSGVPIPPVPSFDKQSPETYGRALAGYTERRGEGWGDQYSVGALTLYDAKDDAVKRSIIQMSMENKTGDKSLIRFRSPAEIKGVAALTHEHTDAPDDTWLYLPASKRVRRISGANRTASFQGTEFTYEDLATRAVDKYQWRFLGDEAVGDAQVYKLEAKPTYSDTSYSRLVVYLSKEHWRAEKLDLYDKAGKLLKILTVKNWKRFHGRYWRATTTEMQNVQTKKRTVIELKALIVTLKLSKSKKTGKPRKSLSDKNFTTRSLEGR
jgi:hypothetical protein